MRTNQSQPRHPLPPDDSELSLHPLPRRCHRHPRVISDTADNGGEGGDVNGDHGTFLRLINLFSSPAAAVVALTKIPPEGWKRRRGRDLAAGMAQFKGFVGN